MSGLIALIIFFIPFIFIDLLNKLIDFFLACVKVIITMLKSKHQEKNTKIQRNTEIKKNISEAEKERLIREYSKEPKSNFQYNNENTINNYDEYYCERCFKRISEEEYEMNDCMCEDCYEDIMNGENF